MSSCATNATSATTPLGSAYTITLGSIIFVITWVFMAFRVGITCLDSTVPQFHDGAAVPQIRALPIGRTAGTLFGATLMVVFQVGAFVYAICLNARHLARESRRSSFPGCLTSF